MTNEDFQQLMLQEIQNIKNELKELPGIKNELKELPGIKNELQDIKTELQGIKNKLNTIEAQTAALTEFKTETNVKLDTIIEDNKSIHEILGEHEVSLRTVKRKFVSAG